MIGFEFTVPGLVFEMANTVVSNSYAIRLCAPGRQVRASAQLGGFELNTTWGLEGLAEADLVVVPGVLECFEPLSAEVSSALLAAADRGARIMSVCIGAFAVASIGLLDGVRATTHWKFAPVLAQMYPRVEVDASVLYIDSGRVLTSAGIASGLDLCLHIVRSDLGAEAAADTARRIVMPPHRFGGQAQYIEYSALSHGNAGLSRTMEWIQENLHLPLTLHDIAQHASMSVRSLNRHFRAEIGATPLQWLQRARLDRARQLLEMTNLSVERVAIEAGFGTAQALRYHFSRIIGTSPYSYRATFSEANAARVFPPSTEHNSGGRRG